MPANCQWPQDWKRSVFIPIPKKGHAKECSNYHTTVLISHASKVMLKILWARLQQYKNQEILDIEAGFRKGRGTRDQIANIHWIMEKAREFQENIYFCLIDYAKAFDCVDHNKLWKIHWVHWPWNQSYLDNTYQVPGTVLSFTHISLSDPPNNAIWWYYYYPNFADERNEKQRD